MIIFSRSNNKVIEKITCRSIDCVAKLKLKQKLIENKESERRSLGPCVLRQLKYFDVGFSFVSDNLQNVYRGVFVISIFVVFMH